MLKRILTAAALGLTTLGLTLAVSSPASAASFKNVGQRCSTAGAHAQTRKHVSLTCVKNGTNKKARTYWRATPMKATPAPAMSVEQRNAQRSAQDYLRFMAFSRTSLIGQLEYEGYPAGVATWAVDSLNTNYNDQAAKSARSYLSLMPFSRDGLIGQLEFEGFTDAQAVYGANAVGL